MSNLVQSLPLLCMYLAWILIIEWLCAILQQQNTERIIYELVVERGNIQWRHNNPSTKTEKKLMMQNYVKFFSKQQFYMCMHDIQFVAHVHYRLNQLYKTIIKILPTWHVTTIAMFSPKVQLYCTTNYITSLILWISLCLRNVMDWSLSETFNALLATVNVNQWRRRNVARYILVLFASRQFPALSVYMQSHLWQLAMYITRT